MKEDIWKIQSVIRINEWLEVFPGNPEAIGWDKGHTKEQAYQLYETFKSQPERSKREDLVYIEPDFEKMKREHPCLYSKYEVAKEILRCGALNSSES